MIIHEVTQGSDDWLHLRCGKLTASEMKLILTPTLKMANNDKERAHLYELAAQRITGHVEPFYINDDMLRGMEDEFYARTLYSEHYNEVTTAGFITDDRFGFTLGYSPDGLVGDDGLIEIKSRRQKYQIETIVTGEVPSEYMLQIQTGLLVTERKWCDFISYSGGLHMYVQRVWPDEEIQGAILKASTAFEEKIKSVITKYQERTKNLIPTERRIVEEMIL